MNKKLVALAAAAVAIVPLANSPASAAAAGGKLAFSCVAALPEFPSPQASGTCGSDTLGSGPVVPSMTTGSILGVTDQDNPFTLVAAGTDNFDASLTYEEPCVAGAPLLNGDAGGDATIGATGRVGTSPVTADIDIEFTWIRGLASTAITITGGTVVFTSGTTDTVTGAVLGAGQASFAPVLTAGNLCPGGGELKAAVAGSAAATIDAVAD